MTPPAALQFGRYIGIDYSGASTPETGLTGIRVYLAEAGVPGPPKEVRPDSGPRRSGHWSRRGLAHWLDEILSGACVSGPPILVAIDHNLSFPLTYFERHGLLPDWPAFLDDFAAHWPTDAPGVKVEDVRRGRVGGGASRSGDAHWRRLAEVRCRAKSVFHFDVSGSVAKSAHAGLPWVRWLRSRLGLRCWPYEGWAVPVGRSVLAEGYPSLCRAEAVRLGFTQDGLTSDQYDALALAAWLRQADADGRLRKCLTPELSPEERARAAVEGWILGVR